MPATMTDDLLAHLAAVRDKPGEPDDADLGALADRLDEAANDQPTEYEDCPRCVGGWERIRCDWCGRTPDDNGYLEHKLHCPFPNSHHFDEDGKPACELVNPCPRDPECYGKTDVLLPNPLRDRAELIRVQVELPRKLDCPEWCRHIPSECRGAWLQHRESALLARNPAWLSVACPECKGEGLQCGMCSGTGDLLRSWPQPFDRATLTRGFLTVTLPSTLCWMQWGHFSGPPSTAPHPVLAAVLDSPVGPWVRRVVVSDREPNESNNHPGEWYWTGDPTESRWFLPPPVFRWLGGRFDLRDDLPRCYHPTTEAAVDALARAVPLWFRRCP